MTRKTTLARRQQAQANIDRLRVEKKWADDRAARPFQAFERKPGFGKCYCRCIGAERRREGMNLAQAPHQPLAVVPARFVTNAAALAGQGGRG